MSLNNIEVYGVHEEKCQRLTRNTQAAIAALDVKAKITCIVEPSSRWKACPPPVLVVNGSILSTGYVMTSDQIQQILAECPKLVVG